MDNTLNKLIQDWLPKQEVLRPFYTGLDRYLEETLLHTSDNLEREEEVSKIIADPLLGYIYLKPIEVAIIDTILFQRLRKIRQLGLAYLVFPSLNYSRFEHSLGVVGRLNQIVNKLLENYSRINSSDDLARILKEYDDPLRLAALMHDIGHCLFSHCSERIINNLQGDGIYPSSRKIAEEFQKHFKKEKLIPFAEVFSVSIIGSRKFYDFIHKLDIYKTKDIPKILECTAKFILGIHVNENPQTVFLSQLISSGLDADKIDYMVREQHYSGIKLEIDLDRILSKLNVFDLNAHQLPQNLSYLKKSFGDDKRFKVLGFSKGGQFVFEEFCIARLALHVKIYLHQKVRTAESQLAKYLEELSLNKNISNESHLQKAHNWLRLPESIIEQPMLLNSLFNSSNSNELFSDPLITEGQSQKLKKIDTRELFVRAFAFGQINSFSESSKNDEITEDIQNFFEQFKEDELKSRIIKEAIYIAEIQNFFENGITKEDLCEIIIDIPRLRFKSVQQGQESLYFERAILSPLKWTIPLDKIVIYFEENRALGYVFSKRNVAHIINIAAEKIIFDLTGKVFNQENNISKTTFADSLKVKKWLSENKYYVKYPELQEISPFLKNADAAEKIKIIHENLSAFVSPKKETITINRILTFVNQFPFELQEACLIFLQHLKIYDERLLTQELKKAIEKNKNVGIAYLGAPSDSGGRISYDLRDFFEENQLELKELNDSMVLNSDALVIYDDNINSGLQLLNILAELLNEKEKLGELNLQEKHVSPLTSSEAKQRIKSIPIHFCFIVGIEGAEDSIKHKLEELLKFNSEYIHIHIHKLLRKNKKIFSGIDSDFQHAKKTELRDFLATIGSQLLLNEGKNVEKADNRKLGYANAEAMVMFPYNIPTMTITALWHNGKLDNDVPWVPLAERRRRSKNGNFIGED